MLVDDHMVVREGLKSILNAHPDMEVVGEASDGREAPAMVEELRPDVVVMDVSMPEMNGAEATMLIKNRNPQVRVVALTIHEDKGYLRQLLEAGASAYVLKIAAGEELVVAIRKAAAGGTYLDSSIAGEVVNRFVRRRSNAPNVTLSERETEVLQLIARGHSNKEIGDRLDIGVKTVETYRQRLMEKLDLGSRVDIVRYASRQGWLKDL